MTDRRDYRFKHLSSVKSLFPPRPGQIGLIPDGAHPSLVARGIDFVTHSPVHHVIVCVNDLQCVEAQPGGAVVSDLTKWEQAIWSNFPLTPEEVKGTVDWALAHADYDGHKGTPYSFLDDFAIGMGLVFKQHLWFKIQKFLSSDKTLQCAQLADGALSKGGGYHVFNDGRPDGAVYPGSFVPIYKENGWWPGE